MDKQTAIDKVMKINGWVREDWLGTLADYVLALPEGATLVEIGTALGRSATMFGMLRPDLKIYTFDNYIDWFNRHHPDGSDEEYKEFQDWHKDVVARHLEEHEVKNVEQVIADSRDYKWEGNPIDMLYWDGGTEYATVRKDYFNWIKYMKPGGFMAFGGYLFEPLEGRRYVKTFVDEIKDELKLDLEVNSNIAAFRV